MLAVTLKKFVEKEFIGLRLHQRLRYAEWYIYRGGDPGQLLSHLPPSTDGERRKTNLSEHDILRIQIDKIEQAHKAMLQNAESNAR